jgi:hypothetical protein
MTWIEKLPDDDGPPYLSLALRGGLEITIQPVWQSRRGNFVAEVWRDRVPVAAELEAGDAWPRYYFDLECARRECEAWLRAHELAA